MSWEARKWCLKFRQARPPTAFAACMEVLAIRGWQPFQIKVDRKESRFAKNFFVRKIGDALKEILVKK